MFLGTNDESAVLPPHPLALWPYTGSIHRGRNDASIMGRWGEGFNDADMVQECQTAAGTNHRTTSGSCWPRSSTSVLEGPPRGGIASGARVEPLFGRREVSGNMFLPPLRRSPYSNDIRAIVGGARRAQAGSSPSNESPMHGGQVVLQERCLHENIGSLVHYDEPAHESS